MYGGERIPAIVRWCVELDLQQNLQLKKKNILYRMLPYILIYIYLYLFTIVILGQRKRKKAFKGETLASKVMNALVHTSKIKRLYQDIARLPLHDVEIAVKDNICTASMPTTCSSEMLLGWSIFTKNLTFVSFSLVNRISLAF